MAVGIKMAQQAWYSKIMIPSIFGLCWIGEAFILYKLYETNGLDDQNLLTGLWIKYEIIALIVEIPYWIYNTIEEK